MPYKLDVRFAFSDSGRKVMHNAERAARELGHVYLGTEHQVAGILGYSRLADPFKDFGVTFGNFRDRTIAILGTGNPASVPKELLVSPGVESVLRRAEKLALYTREGVIYPSHMLEGMAQEGTGLTILRNIMAEDLERKMQIIIEDIRNREGAA